MTTVARHPKDLGGLVPAEDFEIEDIWLAAGDGRPRATVSVDGARIHLTCRFGCWGTVPDERGCWRTVFPEYAAVLQQAARRLT